MERLLLPNTTPSAPTSTTLPLWLLFAVAAASSSSLLLPLYFELDTSAFTLLLCISSTTTSVCLTRTLQVTASWLRCCSNDSDLGLTIRSFLSRRGRTVHRILPLCWSIQPNVLSIMNLVTCRAALNCIDNCCAAGSTLFEQRSVSTALLGDVCELVGSSAGANLRFQNELSTSQLLQNGMWLGCSVLVAVSLERLKLLHICC